MEQTTLKLTEKRQRYSELVDKTAEVDQSLASEQDIINKTETQVKKVQEESDALLENIKVLEARKA